MKVEAKYTRQGFLTGDDPGIEEGRVRVLLSHVDAQGRLVFEVILRHVEEGIWGALIVLSSSKNVNVCMTMPFPEQCRRVVDDPFVGRRPWQVKASFMT